MESSFGNISFEKCIKNPKSIEINPLAQASETGNLSALQFLIEECNLDANTVLFEQYSSLWLAAGNGHKDCVEYLLDHGANIDFQDKGQQETPLHATVMRDADFVRPTNDFFGCMKLLVDRGVNVNIQDFAGDTPIFFADFEMTKYLVDNGADFTIKNKKGETPLHHAEKQNYFDNSKKVDFLRSLEK